MLGFRRFLVVAIVLVVGFRGEARAHALVVDLQSQGVVCIVTARYDDGSPVENALVTLMNLNGEKIVEWSGHGTEPIRFRRPDVSPFRIMVTDEFGHRKTLEIDLSESVTSPQMTIAEQLGRIALGLLTVLGLTILARRRRA